MIIVPVFTLIVLTILIRFQAKEWTAPGPLFAGYWSLWTCFALIFSPQGYPVTTESIWWIVLFVFSLALGAILGKPFVFRKKEKNTNMEVTDKLAGFVVFFSVIGIIGVLFLVYSLGQSFTYFFSFSALQNVASSVSEARYTVGYEPPGFYTLSTCFTYAASYLGGLLWVEKKNKIAFLPFLPVILSSAVMTTKAGLLFQVFMWIGGWLAGRVRKGQTSIPSSVIMKLALTSLLLTFLFVITSALRYGVYSFQELKLIYEKLTVYYIGFLSGFSQWITMQNFSFNELGLGRYSIAGVYDVLGITQRSQGIINDTVVVGDYSTNIYTLFRFLIQDFGLTGTVGILFVVGFLSSVVFERTKKGSLISMSFLMFIYTQFLFSNTTSILGYNTMIVAWMITFIFVLFHFNWKAAVVNRKQINVFE